MANRQPLEITNLRLSNTSNLLGVDDPAPPISWCYSSPHSSHGWWQQTYVLSLRSWDIGDTPEVDSLKPISILGPRTLRSENIPWPKAFPRVEPGRVYELSVVGVLTRHDKCEYFTLKLRDGWEFGTLEGDIPRPADVSPLALAEELGKLENAAFDTAMTAAVLVFEGTLVGGFETWCERADGVMPISTPWDLDGWEKPKPVSVFRTSFTVGTLSAARLHVTAFGVYKIFINGRAISQSTMDPGWTEYKLRICYQTYDVYKYFIPGENVVTVFVADGWYRGRLASGGEARRGIFGKETGFVSIIEIYKPSGGKEIVKTGSTASTGWKCTRRCPIRQTEIYDGEQYDSRINIDDISDQANIWEDVKVMTDIWQTSSTPTLQASIAPPITCTELLSVQQYITSPTGKTILDFGQNTAGRVRIKGSAPSGTRVTFVHVEVLEPDGTPCTGLLREAKATDSYIFNGSGVEEWEPEFTFHGFRYVQVDPWIEGLEVTAKVYGSNLPTGLMKFKSSHGELNRLVENIRWSARANFLSICTDCPQRDERMGWTGDINAFGPTAVYIFDCQTFLRSWLQGLVDGQNLGGRSCPPLVSPNALYMPGSHRPTALWQDVLVTLPWYLYQTYGDTSLLKELYSSMVDYQTKGIPKDPRTGLWAASFQFGDWLDPTAPPERPDLPATHPMFVANTWLCNITNTLWKITTVLQDQDGIREWKAAALNLKSKWQAQYILPIASRLTDLGITEPPKILTQDTQTAYSLALNFRLLPNDLVKLAINRLHHLVINNNCHLSTGFAGTPELLHAICASPSSPLSLEENLASISLAYKVLLGPRTPPSWLYPVTMGATTIWERWDAVKPDGSVNTSGMTSLNHYAYGSVGRWIFETVGGIKMRYNGNQEEGLTFIFNPIPNLEHGITWSEMVYNSPKGIVACNWKYESDSQKIVTEIVLPGNCDGEVMVLGQPLKRVGAGKWILTTSVKDSELQLLQKKIDDLSEGWVMV
ncbi:uncharacterized protein DFL_008459 [Arthrobotrys flagrans]|uniref:alpha-L-rhamnosidase n=1 Tax=Arthrobotrys flagrans TaxID=97331 RepID=A0A436ZNT5_ARTFL|nr:hypothetical protein DFL_008459 [Arthrobotrys flagrans]